jgi:hypothetical protein
MSYSRPSERTTRPLVHRVTPACRHADGTISWSSVLDLRRMASEDSDQLVSGLFAIHRLSDLGDVRQTRMSPVDASIDHLNATSELVELSLLR